MRVLVRTLLAILAAFAWASPSVAQPWPARPVRLIVGFTAGGTTDIMARAVAQQLGERFKQAFVIENKPGAGGNLGTEMVVRAPADGYTLLISSVGPIAINPSLFQKLPFNTLTDLVPVVQISNVPNVLVVQSSLPVKTLDEFIAYAKANPGQLSYGSTGVGTMAHLSSFVVGRRAGLDVTHVPYKGAEALRDLLAGRLHFMFATIPSVKPHIDAGSLRPLAVNSAERSRSLPDVPALAERGFPGFDAGAWFGIFAPKGTPPEVVETLNKAVNEILGKPALAVQFAKEGADPMPGTPAQFAEFVQREHDKWRTVVRESGATAD